MPTILTTQIREKKINCLKFVEDFQKNRKNAKKEARITYFTLTEPY